MPRLRKPITPVSPAEVELFREAVGAVEPVLSDWLPAPSPRPPPRPRQRQADEARVVRELAQVSLAELEAGLDEPLAFVRGGANPKLLRQLGRGQYSVRAEVDLHGLSAKSAAELLNQFLTECRQRERWCVRVIHGKGLNSSAGPVLKRLADRLLRQRNDVLAYRSARPEDGGGGAAIVLLKRG